jgi:transcriptional regulator with XRE-family HTH domain
MKRDLEELKEIDEKIKGEMDNIKQNSHLIFEDVNKVKVIKNNIYEKVSKTFVYNLRRLIVLEGTQKNLAKKIGVSEDLLSKYKAGEAFPSIETLIFICELYSISLDKFLSSPITVSDLGNMESSSDVEFDIFEDRYYAYFLVTNIAKEGAIHEGLIEIYKEDAVFKILSNGQVVKCFTGKYNTSGKLLFFNLYSANDGITNISMLKPNVNKNKYFGGLAMLMLPSDANSKPCVQKVLISKLRLDREIYYSSLKEFLKLNVDELPVDHIKLSQWEDEGAYNFIQKLL